MIKKIKIIPPKLKVACSGEKFHPLAPGLVHGEYFNHCFGQESYPRNWAIQSHPKEPRSASNFGKKSAMKTSLVSTATTHDQGQKRSINGLKRKYIDGDEDDKDWNAPRKKSKRTYTQRNMGSAALYPPLALPEDFKDCIISKMDGSELTLLIQKELWSTDVNPDQGRLSLPPNQVSDSFLRPEELEILNQRPNKRNNDQGSLQIPLTDQLRNQRAKKKPRDHDRGSLKIPSRLKLKDKKGITLIQWKLSNSVVRKSYVLRTTWNKVVKKNNLAEGDVIQVWLFRENNNQLHLAIVLVKRAENCASQSAAGSSKCRNADDGVQGSTGVEGCKSGDTASGDGSRRK